MSSRRRDKETHVGQHRRLWAREKAAEQRRLRRLEELRARQAPETFIVNGREIHDGEE